MFIFSLKLDLGGQRKLLEHAEETAWSPSELLKYSLFDDVETHYSVLLVPNDASTWLPHEKTMDAAQVPVSLFPERIC